MLKFNDLKTFAIQYLLKFWLFCTIYFAPVIASMVAISVFILLDFISALMVAIKFKVPITSKKMRDTVGKSASYMLALIVAHIFELQFMPLIPIMSIVACFIASAEAKSIYENLGKITGLDFWTILKDYLSQNKNQNNNKDEKPI